MIRLLCLSFLLIAGLAAGTVQGDDQGQRQASDAAATTPELVSRVPPAVEPLDQSQPLVEAACCKVCSKGKACGNSCISREKTCHKPPGCACDAQ